MSTAPVPSDRTFFIVNAVLSVGALALLTWLLLFRPASGDGSMDLRFMPKLNAALNATSFLLLLAGFISIKRGRADLHRSFMVAAFVVSSLFLVGYLAYHAVHGDTKFGGTGSIRAVYLALLASHVLLSAAVVPLALAAFWFAWKKEFARHKRVTKFLYPIWSYVSVTGVVVFFMLAPYYR
jgi:putative membrane protein